MNFGTETMASDLDIQYWQGRKMNEIKCICCDRLLKEEPIDNPIVIHPVYNGLIFRATGNFGSTIFDPMPIGVEEILQVIICDYCIRKKIKAVTRIHNINRDVTAESGEFIL